MMSARSVQSVIIGSAVAVMGAALLVKGAAITRFEWAALNRSAVGPSIAEAYSDVLGERGAARRSLAPADHFEATSRQAIEDVLVVEPTNGLYWVGLAETLQDEGADLQSVLRAVTMSAVTQPREAATMARRATFLLSVWPVIPETYRHLAIANLVELGLLAPADDQIRIRQIVAAQNEQTRKAIREALLEKANGDRRLLPQYGL